MTSPQTPRALIEHAPQAQQPPFGLLTSATLIDPAPDMELNGVEYETLCSATVREWPPVCASYTRPSGYDSKTADPSTGWTAADPFALYAAEQCLHAGDEQRAQTLVRERIDRGEQTMVERLLYTGLLGNRPAITVDPLVLTDNPPAPLPSLPHAIGIAEHWIAQQYGVVATIHLPRWLGTDAMAQEITVRSGARATTGMGSTVVFGNGYDGRPPSFTNGGDAGSPDQVWIYATLPVTVRRGELLTPAEWPTGAFDPRTNRPYTFAERMYVADFPCRALAIPTERARYTIDAREQPAPAAASAQTATASREGSL